jgi:hypothetical protein
VFLGDIAALPAASSAASRVCCATAGVWAAAIASA